MIAQLGNIRDPKVSTSALASYRASVGAAPDFQRAHCLCNLSRGGVSLVLVDFTVRVFPDLVINHWLLCVGMQSLRLPAVFARYPRVLELRLEVGCYAHRFPLFPYMAAKHMRFFSHWARLRQLHQLELYLWARLRLLPQRGLNLWAPVRPLSQRGLYLWARPYPLPQRGLYLWAWP